MTANWLKVNSPSSSSWDFTPRLLRLLKKFEASACFMKTLFSGPAVEAGGSLVHSVKWYTGRYAGKETQLMQPLTLRIFGAACATGHSCRAGLRRPCVEAQNMKGLNSKGLQFFSCLQPTNKTIFFGKKSHSCIILTWKCKKHSEESQEGCIRPGHLLNSEILRDVSDEEEQEGERGVRRMWEVGWGAWGDIDCFSVQGGSDRADLIRGWNQQTCQRASKSQEGAEGFISAQQTCCFSLFFLWILVEIKMTWNDTIYGTIASVTLATVSLIKKRKHTVGVTRKIIVRAAYALASWIIFVPETMDGRQQKYWCFFFLKKWQKTVEAGSRSRDSLPNVSFETGPLNKAALSARQRVVQESMQPSVCLNFFQPVLWPGPRKEWMFKLFWGKIQESGNWCSERYGDSGVRVLRRYVVSVFYSGRCETEQHRDWRKLQH